MNKEQIDSLQKLSRQEKFEIVQLLWDDIAGEESKLALPEQHRIILEERLKKFESGKTSFKSWDEVKLKYSSSK
jgi:putative addiction module component (TIGR02574 family)